MGECKNHMKVGSINHLCPASVYPQLLLHCLTVGTVSVSAGIVMNPDMLTVGALREIDTKFTGFAVPNGRRSLFLYIRLVMQGRKISVGVVPYFCDFTVFQSGHLRSCQKD